jgi:Putative prokaryotic signal transducing protein
MTDPVALTELGRFSKNEANILIGALDAQGIGAVAFDEGASVADGSQFFIPVRVMVDADDLAEAQAIVAAAAR